MKFYGFDWYSIIEKGVLHLIFPGWNKTNCGKSFSTDPKSTMIGDRLCKTCLSSICTYHGQFPKTKLSELNGDDIKNENNIEKQN